MKNLKKSELSFADGFRVSCLGIERGQQMAFDWDLCAQLINKYYKEHKDLEAEAGLQGDWNYTGGVIFKNGKPVSDSYTYLSSDWATPTLILSWDGEDQREFVCSTEESERFSCDSKWDAISLAILNRIEI